MSALRRLPCFVVVGLMLALSLVPRGFAQTASSDNAAALALRDDQIRVVNALLTAFSEVMGPDERAILQETDVRIPMDYDMTRVMAYRDGGRMIEISFGFLGVLIELCDDWILSEYYSAQDPDIYNKYEAYLTYLNGIIDRNERSVGQDPVTPQPFADFAGIPAEVAAEIMSRSDAQEYLGALRMAAIAFVLAHEIGHHVLGHLEAPRADTAAESRARESEADRYAAELTMRVGVPAFGALPALAIFTAAESDVADPDATHPLASCRILEAMIYTVDHLAEDANSAPLFEKSPDMRPGGSQYQTFVTLKNQHCS